MKFFKTLGFACLFLTTLLASAAPPAWKIREDAYKVKFKTKKASGTFGGLKGTLRFDPADPSDAEFEVSIDVHTIRTGIRLKDQHAKNADFFDADRFPLIRFVSARIEKEGSGYAAYGKLTIKDVTKEIRIPFTFTDEEAGGRFAGNFEIDRTEYNLHKKGVGRIIRITLDVPVTRAADTE